MEKNMEMVKSLYGKMVYKKLFFQVNFILKFKKKLKHNNVKFNRKLYKWKKNRLW